MEPRARRSCAARPSLVGSPRRLSRSALAASGWLSLAFLLPAWWHDGQPIATNATLAGQDQNTILAPREGVVLGMTTLPAVSPGDAVAHLAFPSESAFKKMSRVIGKLPEDSLLARLHDDLAASVLVSDLDDMEG